MWLNMLFVAIGGFFGANCRYIMSQFFKKRIPSKWPLGTLAVNLLGSFLLGYLIGANGEERITLLLGTGFMGAFTTYSTFNLETIQLLQIKEKGSAIVYFILTYFGGIMLAFLGLLIGKI